MPRLACLLIVLGFLCVLGVSSLEIQGPAAIYPRALIAAALVLLAATAFIELRRHEGASGDTEMQMLVSGPRAARARMAGFTGAWIAYPLVLPLLGFISTTTLVLFISATLTGSRRFPSLIIGSLLFAIVFAVALKTIIYVPVPSAWPDRLIDSMVYAMRRA